MNWHETLSDIFAGYVNQQTLEEAADQMVFVSSDNGEYHNRFIEAIDNGLESIGAEASLVKEIVNRSGYRVTTAQEASDMLRELRRLYLERFERAVS